jgi:hypothetical protein
MTRARLAGMYGRRGCHGAADAGIRRVAPTFGKELHLTSSSKSAERFAVDSDAERLVSHLLTIDPRVQRFYPQPFTVDLIDGRVLRTSEEVSDARRRHRHRVGRMFYTPDFGIHRVDWPRGAAEVKLEGFEGDSEYENTLARAEDVLDACGWQFRRLVVPADSKHPMRSNLPLLKKAAGRHDLWPDNDEGDRIEAAFGDGPMTLSDACGKLGVVPSMVPIFLVSGILRADVFRHYINGSLLLEAAFGDLSHLQLAEELSA